MVQIFPFLSGEKWDIESNKPEPMRTSIKSSSSMCGTAGMQIDLLASTHMTTALHRLSLLPCFSLGDTLHYGHVTSGRGVYPLLPHYHSHSLGDGQKALSLTRPSYEVWWKSPWSHTFCIIYAHQPRNICQFYDLPPLRDIVKLPWNLHYSGL